MGSQRPGSGSWGTRCGLLSFGLAVSWKFTYSYSALTVEHRAMEAGSGQGCAGAGPIKISGSLQTGNIPLVV